MVPKQFMTRAASFLVAAALCGGITLAAPLSMKATYFTVSPGDPDFDTNPCCDYVSLNEVQNALGPDGLPVYNPSYTIASHGGIAGTPLHDTNGSGELTWWSPSMNSHVTQTGTGTITLPYSNGAFFPSNGSGPNDASGFQTAIFEGTLDVPVAESVSFSFGADDDAFLVLDGAVIDQIGSIHTDSPAPVTTSVLAPGSYSLELFFADRHQTGSALNFAVTTEDVTVSPPPPPPSVPEPATIALILAGLAGCGAVRQRKLDQTSR